MSKRTSKTAAAKPVETDRRKLFIRELAQYLAGQAALRSIGLQMGDKNAQEWAKLRGLTPLFGYPTVDEAEKTLREWLLGSSA